MKITNLRTIKKGGQFLASFLMFSLLVNGVAFGTQPVTDGVSCPKAGQVQKQSLVLFKCSLVWVTQSRNKILNVGTQINNSKSKSFRVESIAFSGDSASARAKARITNLSTQTLTAQFIISIFGPDEKTVQRTLDGDAFDVAQGDTVTVELFDGVDPPFPANFPDGNFKWLFETRYEGK